MTASSDNSKLLTLKSKLITFPQRVTSLMQRFLSLVLALLSACFPLCGGSRHRIFEDYDPLWTLAEPYGFKLGGAFGYGI